MHLLLNHFPIVGTVIGCGIMALGYFTQSDTTKRIALIIWFAMALFAIPVFLTGESAEERVEDMAGVSESMIDAHADAADVAFWVMEALGLLSLITLFGGSKNEKTGKMLTGISFALSLITFGLMARTGYLGGQIRHTEISGGVATEMPAKKSDDDDD